MVGTEQTQGTAPESTGTPGYASVSTDDGAEVETNHVPEAQMEQELQPQDAAGEDKSKDQSGGKPQAKDPKAKPQEKAKAEGDDGEPEDKRSASWRTREATRQAAEFRRKLEAREQELARERSERMRLEQHLRQSQQPATGQPGQPGQGQPQGEDAELDPADFPTYDAYVKAMIKREGSAQADARVKKEVEQFQIQQSAMATAHQYMGEVQEFSKRTEGLIQEDGSPAEDIDPLVLGMEPSNELAPGQPAQSSNHLADLIVQSEIPADLLRYFSQHKDEWVGILRSRDQADLQRKFLRLEGRLMALAESRQSQEAGAAEEPPPPAQAAVRKVQPASKAPRPIKPVQGSAPKGEPDPDKMTDDEYYEFREAQERAAR